MGLPTGQYSYDSATQRYFNDFYLSQNTDNSSKWWTEYDDMPFSASDPLRPGWQHYGGLGQIYLFTSISKDKVNFYTEEIIASNVTVTVNAFGQETIN